MQSVCTGTISGAVGTTPHLGNLRGGVRLFQAWYRLEPVPTQIVARTGNAQFLYALAAIGGALRGSPRKPALQGPRSGRWRRASPGAEGSSRHAPQEEPLIIGERLCGFARLLRGYLATGLENTALWHERDISHSGAERFIFPDACGVDPVRPAEGGGAGGRAGGPQAAVERNSSCPGTGIIPSLLLLLVNSGATREDSYVMIQKAAMAAMDRDVSLLEAALQSEEIMGELTGKRSRTPADGISTPTNEAAVLRGSGSPESPEWGCHELAISGRGVDSRGGRGLAGTFGRSGQKQKGIEEKLAGVTMKARTSAGRSSL
jgi:adenylosuccinate lyase